MSDFNYKYTLIYVKNKEEKNVEKLCIRNWRIMFPSELETASNGFDSF